MQKTTSLRFKPFYPWLVWGLGAAFFFSEYFARVSPGVMVPDLMRAFNVTAVGIGSISAFFYYAYVSMQVPVGALVDRFGPHRLLTVMAGLCALGCFLFASSHSIFIANLSRLLMGFGAAFAFVGALKLATLWFPSQRFGLLAGTTQALGMLGAAVGEGPLAVTVAAIGWRQTIYAIGIILLAISILIGFFVRDRVFTGPKLKHGLMTTSELWQGFLMVMRNPQSWFNALFVGLLYAPTAAFAELWGTSFFSHTYGLSNQTAAAGISCIFVGWAVGGPITGWISDRMRRRKPVMIFSALASLITMSAVLYVPGLPIFFLFLILFLYGVANTGVGTSYALASEINPHQVAGTSMAFANMASVLLGAAFQPVIGWFLDLQWNGLKVNGVPYYSAHDFRMAMLALPVCLILCLISVVFVRETYCRILGEAKA